MPMKVRKETTVTTSRTTFMSIRSPLALDGGAQALQVGDERVLLGLARERELRTLDVRIGIRVAEHAQHAQLLLDVGGIRRRLREPRVSGHVRFGHHVARVVEVDAM